MELNYVAKTDSYNFYSATPTESYELDFDKIKTVEDCVLVIKAMLSGLSNGYEPTVNIDNTSYLYEKMRHLAKDK